VSGAPAAPARLRVVTQVLVPGLTVDGCRVVTEAGHASDHCPVVVDLRAPDA